MLAAAHRLVGLVKSVLTAEDPGLVVAVSGGADSVALVRAAALAGARPLVLAHLNHGLRGQESDGDADFVALLHGRLAAEFPDVLLDVERIDVAEQARLNSTNLEGHARRLRYRWLSAVARRRGVMRVATAHTADDQAETVLHRLLRGAGLQGLRGVAATRPLEHDVLLVRPFLPATRADVLDFLQSLDQPHREDSSNRDLKRTRNRIRHELLPYLKTHFNAAVVDVLGRLAQQADEIQPAEVDAARVLLAAAERPRAGPIVVLDCRPLASSSRISVRAVLRLIWSREGWPVDRIGFDQWQRLTRLVFDDETAVDLPGGINARRRGDVLNLGPTANRPGPGRSDPSTFDESQGSVGQ